MKLYWYPGGGSEGLVTFPGTDSTGVATYSDLLIDYTGFSGSPVSQQAVRSPGQNGKTWLNTQYDPRTISFSIIVQAPTLQQLLNVQRELVAAFDVGKGMGALVWEQEDGSQYLLNCISNGPCPTSLEGVENRGELFQKFTFPLIAHDPFWYSGSSHLSVFKFTGTSFFPFNFPFNFQSSQSPSQTLNNAGSHNAPIYLKFIGPMVNPILYNNLTGQSLGLTMTIAAGESVEINTDENDLYALYNATGGTTLAFQYLNANTVLRDFLLIPGDNPCQLSAYSYGGGAELQVEWSDKYSGV